MRWSAFLVAASATLYGLVCAQTEGPGPALSPCVTKCIFESMPASGCGTDAACLCENQPYKTAVQNCLQANCPVRESLVAGRYQSEACGAPKRSQVGLTRRVVWTLYTTAAISVVGRFIFRNPYLRGSGYGADDWTMLLAFILLTPQNAIIHAMTIAGLGLDIWALEPDNITTLLHDFWVEAILYTFVMSTIKVSILLLYLRIWTSGTSWTAGFRRMCFILIAINIAFGVALGLTVIFECTPISYAWTRWDGEHTGKCIDYSAQSYAISGLNTLLDLVTFLLPIPKLLQLPISLRKKVGVCLIFALGLLATTASVVRLIYLIEYSTSPNFSWWFAPIATWTSLECNLAVTTACLPSMAGLFQKIWNHTCKGTKWTYGSSGTNIDNVRLSALQTPSQYFEEDRRSLPSRTMRHHTDYLQKGADRSGATSASTMKLAGRPDSQTDGNKLPRNKPLPSVSTAPDRVLVRLKHKIVRHHRRWIGDNR